MKHFQVVALTSLCLVTVCYISHKFYLQKYFSKQLSGFDNFILKPNDFNSYRYWYCYSPESLNFDQTSWECDSYKDGCSGMTITVNKNQLIQTFALNHVVSTEIV